MKKTFLFIIFVTSLAVFTSCSKKADSAEQKKVELENLKSQLTEIQNKINTLEKEIESTNGVSEKPIINVNIKEIQPETFKRFIDVQGVIESQKYVNLSTKMPGTVIKIDVVNGQSVKKGTLMVLVDDEIMQKGLIEIKTGLDFAKNIYEKQKRLYEQKAGSEIQYLQAKNAYESLEKRYETTLEQINSAKIIAPFDGVVDMVYPKLGETVSPGFPVVKLVSMSDVKVKAEISETYSGTFKQGDFASILFKDLNIAMDSRISTIQKSIDPRNRTFLVEIKLPKVPNDLKPNMVCNVSINDITKPNSIIIPLSIIQKVDNNQYVFVAVDENGLKSKKRLVKTGLVYQDKVEIIDGLSAGDKIITNGGFDVSENQPINIIK